LANDASALTSRLTSLLPCNIRLNMTGAQGFLQAAFTSSDVQMQQHPRRALQYMHASETE